MRKPSFSPIFAAFAVLLIMVLIPSSWVENLIPKSKVREAATELNPFMFQGKFIQDQALKDPHYLPMYGSSELARLDRYHPSDYFQEVGADFTPFLVGRGGMQSLVHFMNLSDHIDSLKGKKIVFVLSPQWFQPKGSDDSHFDPNYSTLQGYDLAFNNKLNPNVKKQAIQRILHFTPVKNDPILSTLYKGEISNDSWAKQKAMLVRPFAFAYRDLLEKKDLVYSFVGGVQRAREMSPAVRNKSWSQLMEQATNEGKQQATNNQFYVINSQFDVFKKQLPQLKDFRPHATYQKSVEYNDFQLVLDVLKQAGADPLFISIPVNGKYYDYTGFPRSGRTVYYNKVKNQIEKEGFQIADFSNHEYDPYFLKDTIHVGWKGWVYTDKAISDFYYGHNISKKKSEIVRAK